MNARVTSTIVLAAGGVRETAANVIARAPRTNPPTCESGNTSQPASRTRRPQIEAHGLVPGNSAHQASPSTTISTSWIKQIAAKPVQPKAPSERVTASTPKYTTSAVINASPASAATIETSFIRALLSSRVKITKLQALEHNSSEPRNEPGLQQVGVEISHTPMVLGL